MIENITFCTVDDLEELTGLTHKELWEYGFNLDDCDGVMILDGDALPLKMYEDFYGIHYYLDINLWEYYYDGKISYVIYDILANWENYSAGCNYTRYDGKIYVSKHH